jgi:hypothetical protein
VDLKNVRHLREVLVINARGKATSIMQYSSQNVSHFRPNFVEVPLDDQVGWTPPRGNANRFNRSNSQSLIVAMLDVGSWLLGKRLTLRILMFSNCVSTKIRAFRTKDSNEWCLWYRNSKFKCVARDPGESHEKM